MVDPEPTHEGPIPGDLSSEGEPIPGIPEAPEGTPVFGEKTEDSDEGRPVGPTPVFDFWKALYSRRSVRKRRSRWT